MYVFYWNVLDVYVYNVCMCVCMEIHVLYMYLYAYMYVRIFVCMYDRISYMLRVHACAYRKLCVTCVCALYLLFCANLAFFLSLIFNPCCRPIFCM
jgi:hypothetical protein